MKIAYEIEVDGIYSYIKEVKVDRIKSYQYKTFTEAKKELLNILKYKRDDLNEAIKNLRTIKKKDVEKCEYSY